MLKAGPIKERLATAVGSQNLRTATAGDSVCGVPPQFVAEPENEEQLASLLSCADDTGVAVVPRGRGTKLDWGNPPKRADVILSTARLDRVLEHAWADLTVTVQSGCTVQALQNTLVQHGQRLACDCLWPERATIGGLLSTNDSGALRLRFGALRDLIIGVTLALPDGTLASSGGKVVKNVAGYDLQKLMTGSFGTLGIITQATFRLYPLPRVTRTFTVTFTDAESANQLALKLFDSQIAYTGIQLRAENQQFHIDLRLEGTAEGLDAQVRQLKILAPSLGETGGTVWRAREELFADGSSTVLKITLLPSQLSWSCNLIVSSCDAQDIQWSYVVQACGIGLLKLTTTNENTLSGLIQSLRAAMESQGGSLVVLRLSPALRSKIDSWGAAPDSLPLMRRVKERFDPAGILNPGRFVGGI